MTNLIPEFGLEILSETLSMDELLQNQMFASHVIAAVRAVTLGTSLTYPFDTIKTLIQDSSASNKQFTATQVFKRVQSLTGNSGLYNGFGWAALGRIPGVGARFGTYEILTAFYKDGGEDNHIYVYEALMTGIEAGAIESVISSLFEIMKLHAQVTYASRIPTSTFITEERGVVLVIARFLSRYALDKKALENSENLMSTLTTKHPNMIGALKEYP